MNAKVLGVLSGVIVLVVTLILIPVVIDSTHDFQTSPAVYATSVTTAKRGTTATVTLDAGHYYSDECREITVTSDNSSDSPACSSYVGGTRVLTVEGLAAYDSRTLTVSYITDALGDFAGANALAGLIPLLVVVGAVVGAGAIIVRSAH